jgi:hypothetical protein
MGTGVSLQDIAEQVDPETMTLGEWKRARAAEDRCRRIDEAFARLSAARSTAGDGTRGCWSPARRRGRDARRG